MAGTSYLPLVVEVAFGAEPLDTGTPTWTDISAHVRRGSGLDFSRGWDTESGEPIAGRLTLTVNNDDGDFTPGATGAYGLIRNRLPIRVSAVVGTGTGNALIYDETVGWYDMAGATYDDTEIGTMVLWTGLVESWRIMWENGVRSQVALTCVDRWAAIRRLRFDGRFIERVTAGQSPANFWTFTAETTTENRAEASAGGLLLTAAGGRLNAPSIANPQGWRTGPQTLVADCYDSAGANVLFVPGRLLPAGATSVAWTVSAWAVSTGGRASVSLRDMADPVTPRLHLSVTGGTAYLAVARSGGPGAEVYRTSAVTSGWHHLAASVAVDGAGACTLKWWLDGVLLDTDTTTWTSGGFTAVADAIWRVDDTHGCAVAYLSTWDRALTTAEVLEQYQAGATMGVAGETADARAQRLLNLASPSPTLTDVGTFTSTMSKQSLVDKSLGEALMECAAAEAGALHIDTDGWPVLTSRSWRTGNAAAFTIPAHALTADVSWTLDDQQLCNSATVDRMVADESAGTVKATDDASVATYGEQSRSLSLWLHTDAQAIDRANAESHMFATPMPRSADLSVDVLTKAATIPAATLLAANIGDRIAVSGMPAEAPGETEFYIDSITDRVTASEWQRTFTVSPRRDFWTLQDATFGVIDSVYVLAY